jgi:hypothetical protein
MNTGRSDGLPKSRQIGIGRELGAAQRVGAFVGGEGGIHVAGFFMRAGEREIERGAVLGADAG